MTPAQILAYNRAAVATATGQVDQQQAAARAPLAQAAAQAAALAHQLAVGTLRYVGAGRVWVRQAELGTVLTLDPATKTCTVRLQTDAVQAPITPLHVSYGSGNPKVGKSDPVFVPYTLARDPANIERGPIPDVSHLPWLLAPGGRWLYYLGTEGDGIHLHRVLWPPDFSNLADPTTWWQEHRRRDTPLSDPGGLRLVGAVTVDGTVQITLTDGVNTNGPFYGYQHDNTTLYRVAEEGFGAVTTASVDMGIAGSNNEGTELAGYKENISSYDSIVDVVVPPFDVFPAELPPPVSTPHDATLTESVMAGTLGGAVTAQQDWHYFFGPVTVFLRLSTYTRDPDGPPPQALFAGNVDYRNGMALWNNGFYLLGQVWDGPSGPVYAHLIDTTDASTPGSPIIDATLPDIPGTNVGATDDALLAAPVVYDLFYGSGTVARIRLTPPVPIGIYDNAIGDIATQNLWLGYDGATLYGYVALGITTLGGARQGWRFTLTAGVQTWTAMGHGIRDFGVGSRDGQVVFANSGAGLLYTDDAGATWAPVAGLPPGATALDLTHAQFVDL